MTLFLRGARFEPLKSIVPEGVPAYVPLHGNAGTERREGKDRKVSFSLQAHIPSFGSLDLFPHYQLMKSLDKSLIADSKAGAKIRS